MEAKQLFQGKLPVKISVNINKYLGMPTHFGLSKEQDFSFIMNKIWSKLKGWKEKSLSFEGKGVLIMAVAHAIPTYIMSYFLLPKGICDKIERTVCNFSWGNFGSNMKIHWVHKDKLFKSKHDGGMGSSHLGILIGLCWPNKFGGCTIIQPPSLPSVLRQNTSLIQMF